MQFIRKSMKFIFVKKNKLSTSVITKWHHFKLHLIKKILVKIMQAELHVLKLKNLVE